MTFNPDQESQSISAKVVDLGQPVRFVSVVRTFAASLTLLRSAFPNTEILVSVEGDSAEARDIRDLLGKMLRGEQP